MDALRATQDGNYLLFDGGKVYEQLTGATVDDAANFLFDQLVALKSKTVAVEHESLNEATAKIVEESGLLEHPLLRQQLPTEVAMLGVNRKIRFDYALMNGSLQAVFQHVPLRAQASQSAALTFYSLVDSGAIPSRSRCCALVDTSHAKADPSLMELMSKVGEVADIAEPKKAIARIKEIAKVA